MADTFAVPALKNEEMDSWIIELAIFGSFFIFLLAASMLNWNIILILCVVLAGCHVLHVSLSISARRWPAVTSEKFRLEELAG